MVRAHRLSPVLVAFAIAAGTSAGCSFTPTSPTPIQVLQGQVQTLLPPSGLMVADRSITTDASTQFYLAGQPTTYMALVVGQRITVRGQSTASQLLATQIDLEPVSSPPEFPVAGVVHNLSGERAAFEFTLNGTPLRGDTATVFLGAPQFNHLANGAYVHAMAAERTGFTYLVNIAILPGGR
jgi:hypothetical protein